MRTSAEETQAEGSALPAAAAAAAAAAAVRGADDHAVGEELVERASSGWVALQ